jgi:DegV family protein with EDD domain
MPTQVNSREAEQPVRIVTDSGCDLPRQIVEHLKITVVPLVVRFGAEVHEDGMLSIDKFWQKTGEPHHPQTSQPSVGVFEEAYEPLVSQGKQVLCLTITSRHSGTFNAARVAAERFGDAVCVFDSLSVSLGLGLQAILAAQAAKAGHSMQQIVALVQDMRARMRLMILLDTLRYLRSGGRADALIAAADRMMRALNVKPLINLVDGQLRLMGTARSFEKGLNRMMSLVAQLEPLEHLAVVHTRRQSIAEEMANRLAECTGFRREHVWVRETGPALASHAGPGVIGVLGVPALCV